jgi:hypothetical protein
MMKKYQANSLISVHLDNADIFNQLLSERLLEYQNLNMEVEIQYQHSDMRISALVLAYIMEATV